VAVTSASPADRSLADPAAVATELGTGDDLTAIVEQISVQIQDWLGRVLVEEAVTETFPGSDRYRLVLSRTPVTVLTEVRLDSVIQTPLADYVIEDSGKGFLFHREFFERFNRGSGGVATIPLAEEPRHVWQVDYTGGYVVPPATATGVQVLIPSVFHRAVLAQVKYARSLLTADATMRSESFGDYSYTRADGAAAGMAVGSGGLIAQVQEMLRPYQRITMA